MKIAIHQPRISYYTGGGERVPMEHAKYLSMLGNEIFLITTRPDKFSEIFLRFKRENPKVKIVYFNLKKECPEIYKIEAGQNQKRWNDESLAFGRLTREFYLKNNFDIVATHYAADAIGIPKNQKVVLHLHGFPQKKFLINSTALKKADCLIGVADFVNKQWKRLHNINKKIHRSYNGIDIKKFHSIKCKEKCDLLYVGRLIKIKGVSDLIKAVSIVSRKYPDIKVIIGGTGPEKDNLKNLIKNLGRNKNIRLIGSIPEADLVKFYNGSKICIFPSTAREGVLTTMLEAAACGSCIITTKCCGMPEFIKHDKNGLLVKPADPENLSRAINSLLLNKNKRKDMGRAALCDIKKNWTWQKRIKELDKIYKYAARNNK